MCVLCSPVLGCPSTGTLSHLRAVWFLGSSPRLPFHLSRNTHRYDLRFNVSNEDWNKRIYVPIASCQGQPEILGKLQPPKQRCLFSTIQCTLISWNGCEHPVYVPCYFLFSLCSIHFQLSLHSISSGSLSFSWLNSFLFSFCLISSLHQLPSPLSPTQSFFCTNHLL